MVNCIYIDGKTYVGVEKFEEVDQQPLLLQVYSGVISTADGLPFYIGWRWTNDDNTGSQFSLL
jgi:hypothetical protein